MVDTWGGRQAYIDMNRVIYYLSPSRFPQNGHPSYVLPLHWLLTPQLFSHYSPVFSHRDPETTNSVPEKGPLESKKMVMTLLNMKAFQVQSNLFFII